MLGKNKINIASKQFDELSSKVIKCAIEVHKVLGPGLLENTYKQCLAHELKLNNIKIEVEKDLPIIYKEIRLELGYRIDLIIENKLIIELKSIENLLPVHHAQIISYMKLSNIKTGLLINFNVKLLKDGIRRFELK